MPLRWEFPDPREEAARTRVRSRIDAWWGEFERRSEDIKTLFRDAGRWNLVDWMRERLGAVNRHLMWEYGPGLDGGHRLVITPEIHRELRPLTREILRRAPVLPGWDFLPYRPPEPAEDAIRTVQGRVGVDVQHATVRAQPAPGNVIHLAFYVPPSEGTQKDLDAGAFIATESFLGEEMLDKWIGGIAVSKEPIPGVPIGTIRSHMEGILDRVRGAMPTRPLWEASLEDEWTVIERNPDEAIDYPGTDDIFMAKTAFRGFWQDAHGGSTFYSCRHSCHGETFVYLKIENPPGPVLDRVQGRNRIEDALDSALRRNRLGALVGGATGIRYSYVDLAVGNVTAAVPLIRDALKPFSLPVRSWLCFFDADLAQEWIGVFDDAPPPPGMSSLEG